MGTFLISWEMGTGYPVVAPQWGHEKRALLSKRPLLSETGLSATGTDLSPFARK
jgi:hypothetical protein